MNAQRAQRAQRGKGKNCDRPGSSGFVWFPISRLGTAVEKLQLPPRSQAGAWERGGRELLLLETLVSCALPTGAGALWFFPAHLHAAKGLD